MCIKISGNNFITYMRKKTNLVIVKAGKNFRLKIRSCYKIICPHGVPPGMFSMVIVDISTESVKACSFHKKKNLFLIHKLFILRLLDTFGSQITFFLNFYRNLPQYPCCSIRATGIKIDK